MNVVVAALTGKAAAAAMKRVPTDAANLRFMMLISVDEVEKLMVWHATAHWRECAPVRVELHKCTALHPLPRGVQFHSIIG